MGARGILCSGKPPPASEFHPLPARRAPGSGRAFPSRLGFARPVLAAPGSGAAGRDCAASPVQGIVTHHEPPPPPPAALPGAPLPGPPEALLCPRGQTNAPRLESSPELLLPHPVPSLGGTPPPGHGQPPRVQTDGGRGDAAAESAGEQQSEQGAFLITAKPIFVFLPGDSWLPVRSQELQKAEVLTSVLWLQETAGAGPGRGPLRARRRLRSASAPRPGGAGRSEEGARNRFFIAFTS